MCLFDGYCEEKIVSGYLQPVTVVPQGAFCSGLGFAVTYRVVACHAFGCGAGDPALTLPDRASSDTISEKLVLMMRPRTIPAYRPL
jgi:hypothetical protein